MGLSLIFSKKSRLEDLEKDIARYLKNDGQIDKTEYSLLVEKAKKYGLKENEFQALIVEAYARHKHFNMNQLRAECLKMLKDDGKISEDEYKTLQHKRESMNLSEEDLHDAISETKAKFLTDKKKKRKEILEDMAAAIGVVGALALTTFICIQETKSSGENSASDNYSGDNSYSDDNNDSEDALEDDLEPSRPTLTTASHELHCTYCGKRIKQGQDYISYNGFNYCCQVCFNRSNEC